MAGLVAIAGLFTACMAAPPAAIDDDAPPASARQGETEIETDELTGAGEDIFPEGDAGIDPDPNTADAGANAADAATTPPRPPVGPKCPWAQRPVRKGLAAAGGRLFFDTANWRDPLYLYPRPTNPTSFVARIRVVAVTAGQFSLHYVCGIGLASAAAVGISSTDGAFAYPRVSTAPAVPPKAAGVVLELGRAGNKLWSRTSLNGVQLGRIDATLTGTSCELELKSFAPGSGPGHVELDDFVLEAGNDSCWDDFAAAKTY